MNDYDGPQDQGTRILETSVHAATKKALCLRALVLADNKHTVTDKELSKITQLGYKFERMSIEGKRGHFDDNYFVDSDDSDQDRMKRKSQFGHAIDYSRVLSAMDLLMEAVLEVWAKKDEGPGLEDLIAYHDVISGAYPKAIAQLSQTIVEKLEKFVEETETFLKVISRSWAYINMADQSLERKRRFLSAGRPSQIDNMSYHHLFGHRLERLESSLKSAYAVCVIRLGNH